jgi:hypothetical protein
MMVSEPILNVLDQLLSGQSLSARYSFFVNERALSLTLNLVWFEKIVRKWDTSCIVS